MSAVDAPAASYAVPAISVLPDGLPEIGVAGHVRLAFTAHGGMTMELATRIVDVQVASPRPGVRGIAEVTVPDLSFLPLRVERDREHTLVWGDPQGQMEVPVMLGATNIEGTWLLEVSGPALLVQRRRFYRLDLQGAAWISRRGTHGPLGAPVDGQVVDVSEGGVQIACPVDVDFGLLSPVHIAVDVPGATFSADGVVVRRETLGSAVTLSVRFDDPEAHGDEVRKAIFAEQLRRRRS
jgi:hypothetical protein